MHPTWEDFTRSVKCLTALRLVYMLGGCRKDPPVLTADLAVHKPFNKLCHLKNMVAVALLVKSSYLIQPFLFYFCFPTFSNRCCSMPSNISRATLSTEGRHPKVLWDAKMAIAFPKGRHKDCPVLGDEKPLVGKPENHILSTEKKMQIHLNTTKTESPHTFFSFES